MKKPINGTAARAARSTSAPAQPAGRRSVSTRKAKAGKPAAPGTPEAMAAWQKSMAPGPGHRRLDALAGTFKAKCTFSMTPGAPASISQGVSEHRWVLGGRHIEQSYRGTFLELPFEGLGFTGYDNIQQRYVGTWMDNFGTGIMVSTGTGKPTDRQIEFESSCQAPGGEQMRYRSILKIQDDDRHSYEMWLQLPGGKQHRTMLIEYTRK